MTTYSILALRIEPVKLWAEAESNYLLPVFTQTHFPMLPARDPRGGCVRP